ncbi:MAG: nucleotide exchange factor GrpE [Lachnospiraceae bacterium]|nr:nucleotide exchange factor GrpE [Lachnospiraceae bacterium]
METSEEKSELGMSFELMEQLIKNQIQVKDELINKLHGELEYYKQDSAERFVKQLMKAVIKVRVDMKRQMASEKWDSMSVMDIKKEYLEVFWDLTNLLEQQNIDEYETAKGEMFDPAIHQSKIIATKEMKLDRRIAESLNAGYRKDDKILIPERVAVYRYKENE